MRVSDQVLGVLSNQLVYSANSVVIDGQLERKLYVKVREVLEACGLVWNRKAKQHLASANTDPAELIALVIATGEIVTAKDLGFFPTPPELARELVVRANVTSGQHVLEPSAGEGAIVLPLLRFGADVVAIERDAARRAELIDRFRGAYPDRLRVDDAIDFLDYEPADPFDAVVMNPPFLKVGKGDHIDHFDHALECVRPGGTVVSVMPSSVEFRPAFRARVEKLGAITPLPEGSFKSSGTGVNTCVVKVRR